jgi:hypothetical protein
MQLADAHLTTIRLYGIDTSNTKTLLENVLAHALKDKRVMFLCNAGLGCAIEQRLRVKLSRVRQDLKANGKRRKHFRLNCDIFPFTEKGLRYDCVVMWISQDKIHTGLELLEDMIGHGKPL